MVAGQVPFVELAVVDAVFAVLLGVVAGDAAGEEQALEDSLGLGEGESRAEGPAAADFPFAPLAQRVGGQQIDGVAAVVVRVVGLHLVAALHIAQRVGGPHVEPLHVDLRAEVEARGVAVLDDVVFAQVLGLVVGTGGRGVIHVAVVVHLLAVGVENLVEVLVVELGVEGDVLREVVFEADDGMLGFLHAVAALAEEGVGLVEVGRAGEEAAEEVHDVVVGACVEEYLAVETAGEFQAQVLVDVVFRGQARLEAGLGEGGVVDEAHPGVEQPFAGLDVEGGKDREVGRGLVLRNVFLVLVDKLIVSSVSFNAESILQFVVSQKVCDLHVGVETANLAVAFVAGAVVEGDGVLRVGHATVEDGRGTGDEHEVGARAVVLPVVVGDGLVAEHLVVETEAEEVQLAAGARVETQLAVDVEEVEGQAAVDIAIELLGGLRQVGVLGGDEVGDGALRCGALAFQRSFQYEAGAEGVDAYLAAVVALVAVARRDVHHRRHASAVFGAEAACVDVGVEDDVGLEDGVEADGVEGVVDNHAVEEAEVLNHGAAADVELAALVAGGAHAGQHLHVLRYVGRAADGGHLLYLRRGDFLHADLCLQLALLLLAVGDFHGLEHLRRGPQVDGLGEDLALRKGNLLRVLLIAYVLHPQRVGAFFDLVDEEEAVDVGGAAVGGLFLYIRSRGVAFVENHVCERDGFAVPLVKQHTLHRALSRNKLKIEN